MSENKFKMITLEKFRCTLDCQNQGWESLGYVVIPFFTPYFNRIEIISTVALSFSCQVFLSLNQYKPCKLTEINSVLNLNSTT